MMCIYRLRVRQRLRESLRYLAVLSSKIRGQKLNKTSKENQKLKRNW